MGSLVALIEDMQRPSTDLPEEVGGGMDQPAVGPSAADELEGGSQQGPESPVRNAAGQATEGGEDDSVSLGVMSSPLPQGSAEGRLPEGEKFVSETAVGPVGDLNHPRASRASPGRRLVATREVREGLVRNCLGLAASLLSLLASGFSKREAVAKSLSQSGEAGALAKAAGEMISDGLMSDSEFGVKGQTLGLPSRELVLAVLANLAMHERTAADAAIAAASPDLAVRTLRASLAHVVLPPGGGIGDRGGETVTKPRGRGPSAPSSRMVLSAPLALVARAATLLGNHFKVLPKALSSASIAALDETSELPHSSEHGLAPNLVCSALQ